MRKDPKNVVVIGSSGGGTATLGHTDPNSLISAIQLELGMADAQISHALLVVLEKGKGMDNASEAVDEAALYEVEELQCQLTLNGLLKDVNQVCRQRSDLLARKIRNNEVQIDGLISISTHVGIFSELLKAVAAQDIPVTGSGGTSLAQISNLYGITLVGNTGGSVATTTYTRSVSYTLALASYWKADYDPGRRMKKIDVPKWNSVLNSCLPAFWGVCILKKGILMATTYDFYPYDRESTRVIVDLLSNNVLPAVCAIVMASSMAPPQEKGLSASSLTMAALIASINCSGSILSALIVGQVVHKVSTWILFKCIRANVPATMTNLLMTGGCGVVCALMIVWWVPSCLTISTTIRSVIRLSVSGNRWSRLFFGASWGCLCCYGSKVGWYHSTILPLILVEMENGDPSFLGAVDELSLVLVCAGTCGANVVYSWMHPGQSKLSAADIALCKRGFWINITCGDFVEVCYPFMNRRRAVNLAGYVASAISCALLVMGDQPAQSMAYLPLPVSVWLCGHDWLSMLVASSVALGIPFVVALVDNLVS